jgi:hypothetical protein
MARRDLFEPSLELSDKRLFRLVEALASAEEEHRALNRSQYRVTPEGGLIFQGDQNSAQIVALENDMQSLETIIYTFLHRRVQEWRREPFFPVYKNVAYCPQDDGTMKRMAVKVLDAD